MIIAKTTSSSTLNPTPTPPHTHTPFPYSITLKTQLENTIHWYKGNKVIKRERDHCRRAEEQMKHQPKPFVHQKELKGKLVLLYLLQLHKHQPCLPKWKNLSGYALNCVMSSESWDSWNWNSDQYHSFGLTIAAAGEKKKWKRKRIGLINLVGQEMGRILLDMDLHDPTQLFFSSFLRKRRQYKRIYTKNYVITWTFLSYLLMFFYSFQQLYYLTEYQIR